MIHIQHKCFVACVALACVLAMLTQSPAAEKQFSFDKDIQVMPSNDGESKIDIRLSVDKTKVKPGDVVKVYFETNTDCYLNLIDAGTSGKITRLWPNQFSGSDNFVRAGQRYSFPGARDSFAFKVSGPEGIERIIAVASTKPDAIIPENEFREYMGGFKSYRKGLKDLTVEARRRVDELPPDVNWGTSTVNLVIGSVPAGGRITSRNVYVVSVGASTVKLQYCEDDATRFARLMGEKLGVPQNNVKLVLGKQATRAGFEGALKWLASKTQPEDLVFIYFSGHGTLIPDPPNVRHDDGLSAAFVCYNQKASLRADDPDIKRILFPGPEFASALKEIPARRKVFVVDSCHSGSIHKEISANLVSKYLPLLSPEEMKEIKSAALKSGTKSLLGPGRYSEFVDSKETLLAACEKQQNSYEDRSKRAGLFTYYLVSNIGTGSSDLRSASEKTRKTVTEETRALPERQTPQIDDEHGLAKDIKF